MGGDESPGPTVNPIPALTPPEGPVGSARTSSSGENPVWKAWDVLAIVGLAVGTAFFSQLAILFGAHYLFYPGLRLKELAQQPLLLIISQFVIDGAIVAYLILWVEGMYRTPFWPAIRWNWPKSIWLMLALGAATFVGLAMVLGSLLPMPKETPFEKLFEHRRDAFLLAIIATTLGPLMEELFFRGFFYPVVARRWGAGWGVFLAALPFALVHMQQYGYSWGILLIIFGVGVVCGAVRAGTGSVAAAFLVHAGYNGMQMLITMLWTHGFTRMPKGLFRYYFR